MALQSASIYFSYILKDILQSAGSTVWLKWPNDFYIKDKKIGGTITTITSDLILCGIGLNLVNTNEKFGVLDIKINIDKILTQYFQAIKKYPTWKQIFSKFEIEFYEGNSFKVNIDNEKILLKDTKLQKDGSLLVDGKKVFSLR